jgi:periplasmic mercuric ion binding protein
MKTIITIALLTFTGMSWAQKAPKTQTIVIHTSAECTQCEERLEKELNFAKGVVFAELDLETQNVTIKYSPKKTDAAKLKSVITSIGYDADELKADQAALQQLPACCRPGGMGEEGGKHHD